jgi:hypothetical protein
MNHISDMVWGAVEPSEMPSSRLRLDFGLRPAILRFNEWAVPGLGGAFFVRQLSWSCMGLRLAHELNGQTTAAKIAEALEALAGWIVVRQAGDSRVEDDRVQGKRKFKQLSSLSFDEISRGGAYVTVPFRRAATRALPGLGFCTEEARFSALTLTQEGSELAENAMSDSQARSRMINWVSAGTDQISRVSESLKKALIPEHASDAEKALVRKMVLGDERRAVLASLLHRIPMERLADNGGREVFLDGLPDTAMRKRMQTCFAFEDLRTASLAAAQAVSTEISGRALSSTQLAGRTEIAKRFEKLDAASSAVRELLDSEAPIEVTDFCAEQGHTSLSHRVLSLCSRIPMIFSVVGEQIDKGVGYTTDLISDEPLGHPERPEVGALSVPRPIVRLKRLLLETGERFEHAS